MFATRTWLRWVPLHCLRRSHDERRRLQPVCGRRWGVGAHRRGRPRQPLSPSVPQRLPVVWLPQRRHIRPRVRMVVSIRRQPARPMIILRVRVLMPPARRARAREVVVMMRARVSVDDMVVVRDAVQALVLQRMPVRLRARLVMWRRAKCARMLISVPVVIPFVAMIAHPLLWSWFPLQSLLTHIEWENILAPTTCNSSRLPIAIHLRRSRRSRPSALPWTAHPAMLRSGPVDAIHTLKRRWRRRSS